MRFFISFILILFVVLIATGLGIGLQNIAWFKHTFLHSNVYNPHVFYAVFLTNDQVYFGHITQEAYDHLILEKVYYLKADAELVQNNEDGEQTPSAKLSLVKLGDELHSPKDRMIINKSQVLFIEEMKEQGIVMDAISAQEKR